MNTDDRSSILSLDTLIAFESPPHVSIKLKSVEKYLSLRFITYAFELQPI